MARNGNAAPAPAGAAPADELAVDIEQDEGRRWFVIESRSNPDAWIRTDNAAILEKNE